MCRYLWPVAPVMYLVLGQIISKLKLRNIWCVIIMGAFLFCAAPYYRKVYEYGSSLNKATTEFQKNVMLDASDYILTNSSHHAWTILSYYYPKTAIKSVPNENFDVDIGDKDVWIFWTSELSDYTVKYYEAKHESCTLKYQGTLGNGTTLFVYKVEKGVD
ncbi:MAG: hypothetical protein NC541_07465 [bacterium]|nr:hypothetical protein [bacterium]